MYNPNLYNPYKNIKKATSLSQPSQQFQPPHGLLVDTSVGIRKDDQLGHVGGAFISYSGMDDLPGPTSPPGIARGEKSIAALARTGRRVSSRNKKEKVMKLKEQLKKTVENKGSNKTAPPKKRATSQKCAPPKAKPSKKAAPSKKGASTKKSAPPKAAPTKKVAPSKVTPTKKPAPVKAAPTKKPALPNQPLSQPVTLQQTRTMLQLRTRTILIWDKVVATTQSHRSMPTRTNFCVMRHLRPNSMSQSGAGPLAHSLRRS